MGTLTFNRSVTLDFEDEEIEVQQKCRAIYMPGPKGTPRAIAFESDETRRGSPENWQPIRLCLVEQNEVIKRIEREWDAEQQRMVRDYEEAS